MKLKNASYGPNNVIFKSAKTLQVFRKLRNFREYSSNFLEVLIILASTLQIRTVPTLTINCGKLEYGIRIPPVVK